MPPTQGFISAQCESISSSSVSQEEKCEEVKHKGSVGCTTTARLVDVFFAWEIENFMFLFHGKKSGEKLKSCVFSADKDDSVQWCLYLYPKGRGEMFHSYVSLYLCLVGSSSSHSITTHFELGIQDTSGEILYSQASKGEKFEELFEGKGYSTFIPHRSLLDNAEHLLPDGSLRLYCRIRYHAGINTVSSYRSITIRDAPSDSLTNHLSQLLESGRFSDITFHVGGREFRAHKLILISRSPVFAAMLKHDLKGRLLDYLVIEDTRPEVFDMVLRFIYTDQVDNLDATTAEDLLCASEKYLLPLLKFQCEQVLIRNVSLENCLKLLLLSSRYSAHLLNGVVFSFIRPRINDLISTADWAALKDSHPDLVVQLLESAFTKYNTSSPLDRKLPV